MDVIREGAFVVTITDGGFAKRTNVEEWAAKGRGILGVRAMKLVEERGSMVGALVCDEGDQIFAIASNGIVIRTKVDQIRPSGRDTMGVRLMNLADGDAIVAVARGGESEDEDESDDSDLSSTEIAESVSLEAVAPVADEDAGEISDTPAQ